MAATAALIGPAGSATAAQSAVPHAAAGGQKPGAPWAQGRKGMKQDTPTAAFGLCRTATDLGLDFEYAAPRREVDAIVDDPINNSGASNLGCTTPQNETTIAVNPRNPRNLVAGANDYRVCCDGNGLNDGSGWAYFSFDGGRSWKNVQLPGLTVQTGGVGRFAEVDSAGDPVVTFAPDGTVYYANIAFSRTSFASALAVSRSRDGGRTWSAPSLVQFDNDVTLFHDKEWIAAGKNGRVIVTWTKFLSDPAGNYLGSPIVAKESMDGGSSWGPEVAVSDPAHPFNQGSQVGYDRTGRLYVAYEGSAPSTQYATDALVLALRTSGSSGFATAELGRVYDDLDCYPVYGGRQTLTNQHFRLNSYPSMTVDPDSGRVTIVWTDNQGSGTCGQGGSAFAGTTSNQVKVVTGRRLAFSAVKTITTGGADKVFPAVGAWDGTIAIGYYTAGYPSTNPACFVKIPDNTAGAQAVPSATSVCLDYAARSSSSGFHRELRLTSEGSNPYVQFADGGFIGDYTQVAVGKDRVAHAVWTDFRGRPGTNGPNQDAYVAAFR
jgi:hypothetical protein